MSAPETKNNIFLFPDERDRRGGRPVEGGRQYPVGYHLLLFLFFHRNKFVTLLSVAASMSQLQVVYVGGVATFSQGDNVVDRRAKWVGVFQTEVHRLAADTTYRLRCVDPLLILFKLTAMRSFLVRPVSHIITNTKERSRRSLVCPYSYLIEKARCRSRTGKVTMTGMTPSFPGCHRYKGDYRKEYMNNPMRYFVVPI